METIRKLASNFEDFVFGELKRVHFVKLGRGTCNCVSSDRSVQEILIARSTFGCIDMYWINMKAKNDWRLGERWCREQLVQRKGWDVMRSVVSWILPAQRKASIFEILFNLEATSLMQKHDEKQMIMIWWGGIVAFAVELWVWSAKLNGCLLWGDLEKISNECRCDDLLLCHRIINWNERSFLAGIAPWQMQEEISCAADCGVEVKIQRAHEIEAWHKPCRLTPLVYWTGKEEEKDLAKRIDRQKYQHQRWMREAC